MGWRANNAPSDTIQWVQVWPRSCQGILFRSKAGVPAYLLMATRPEWSHLIRPAGNACDSTLFLHGHGQDESSRCDAILTIQQHSSTIVGGSAAAAKAYPNRLPINHCDPFLFISQTHTHTHFGMLSKTEPQKKPSVNTMTKDYNDEKNYTDSANNFAFSWLAIVVPTEEDEVHITNRRGCIDKTSSVSLIWVAAYVRGHCICK